MTFLKTTSLLLLPLGAWLYPLCAEPDITGKPAEIRSFLKDIPQTVSLTALGEVTIEADHVEVLLKMSIESKSLEDSLQKMDSIKNQISTLLISKGLGKEDMSFEKFANSPRSGFFGGKSYQLTNLVKVKLKNPALMHDIAKIVDAREEISYGGITYSHSNKEGLKRQALEKACRLVTDKKESYEKNLGVKLITQSFHEGDFAAQVPQAKMVYGGLSKTSLSSASVASMSEAEVVGGPSSMEELTYSISITVQYALIDKP